MEDILIKELLSLVIDTKIGNCHIDNNEIVYYEGNEDSPKDYIRINLDTLGRLCKEYCYKLGYEVDTNITGWYRISKNTDNIFNVVKDGEQMSELAAIIHSTKWIVNQKEQ